VYVIIEPHRFTGTVRAPASKSHTIRRLLIAALGEGVSEIDCPLDSLDTRSCVGACRALGAVIEEHRAADASCPNPADGEGKKLVRWIVRGAAFQGRGGAESIDVGNSGTTLFLALAAAALGSVPVSFDGDDQIRRRGAGPLLEALSALGVKVEAGPGGCVPAVVQGPWKGGRVSISCPTSQYLSALLLAAPLAPAGTLTEIDVPLLNEKPYIEMTLAYLDAQGILYERGEDLSWFRLPGGASYRPMNGPVPGDFSSSAFPAAAAAIGGGPVTLLGLDPGDTQGDKAFFDVLAKMGCQVSWDSTVPALTVSRKGMLRGGEFDLNSTPDMLPACAVVAACAGGDTALVNVAHARIKETDRIAVMAAELGKLGVKVTERPDGLVIHGRSGAGSGGAEGDAGLRGGKVDGHGDHRIVMAFAAAALGASGPVEIAGAESAAVTYPGFLELMGAVQIIRGTNTKSD
jgi:3-phosphoshikimate 1-carboxyvinyltransferase